MADIKSNLIYSLISRGDTILCEYSIPGSTGNFTTIATRILKNLPKGNKKVSYTHDKFIFHIIIEDGLIYLCMAAQEFQRRICFAFLEDIKNQFLSKFVANWAKANSYGLDEEFKPVLKRQMEYYSNATNTDRILKVKKEIDEVKSIMVENIEKVLERGDKIELLVEKTETLSHESVVFKSKSKDLKRHMWWKNFKITLILILVAIAILYFVIAAFCGFDLKCGKSN